MPEIKLIPTAIIALKELLDGYEVDLNGHKVGFDGEEIYIRPYLVSEGLDKDTVLRYDFYSLSNFIKDANALSEEARMQLVFQRTLRKNG